MNLSKFSPGQVFFFLLRPRCDSSGVHEPEGDAAKNEPPASVLFGIHRIDDRSLGCAVVNPARAPTKHSKGLEFWRTLRAGVGRLARSDGDPHYRHGIMKESSPDVSILLRMSNTGSTAVRPNIDVASAPDRPKKNLKHRTKGDEGPVVAAWLHYQLMSGHTDTPTCTCSCHPHLRPANWGGECQSAHLTCSLRLDDVARGHSPSLVLQALLSQSHPCQKVSNTLIVSAHAARNIAAGLRLAIRQSVCIVRERRGERGRDRRQGAPAVSYRQSGEVVATLS